LASKVAERTNVREQALKQNGNLQDGYGGKKWKAGRPEEFRYGCSLSGLTGLAKLSPADFPRVL